MSQKSLGQLCILYHIASKHIAVADACHMFTNTHVLACRGCITECTGGKVFTKYGFVSLKNVAFTQDTRKIILFDNENSLQYVYERFFGKQLNKYARYDYLEHLLRVFCIFRRGTVERIKELLTKTEPGKYVLEYVNSNDDLFSSAAERYNLQDILPVFVEKFPTRLKAVLDWVHRCQQ